MNPLGGAFKFLATTIFNSVLGLIFFLIAGHFANPSFVGKVAIIQLMETITGSFFAILPYSIITREISHRYAKNEEYKRIAHTALSFALLISPFLLFLLFFQSYLWLSIPYFIIYLYTNYQGQVLSGLGKFTEVNVGNAIFTIARWGFSVLAVFYHNVELLIAIWTIGALIKAIYYHLYIPFGFGLDKEVFKEIVKVGLPIYLTGIVSFISSQGDRVITAFLLGSYYLGIYQLVSLVAIVPSILISSLSSSLLPSSTYYYAKGSNIEEMSSLTVRLLTLFSLPIAILAYAISPFFISKLFPQYVLGIRAMELIVLSLTSTMPLQILSAFLVAAKKNYRPFIIIGLISALEVVGVSYYLIPRMGILGAAIAQAFNAIITSALYVAFANSQKVFLLGKKEKMAILIITISFFSLINWAISLVVILILFKISGIISTKDVILVENFIPTPLKSISKLLYLVAK
ncbi:polysaccharide biosynthesis protein [Sulfolobus sp. S-194]|uniref:oligosaccharide flippase family protein n=1 Tax=Sulfolobus sp. S-194 TaxID=2512240 RepID=UPI001437111C|nr:oligosaccharide flippase family protein [Sulfolobus sp. S-194]QIW24509.1 polysaccharide biosynthesis protein [Sulfolobus sp. S-194]